MHGVPDTGAPAELDRRTRARAVVLADPGRYRDALTLRRVVEPGAAYVAAQRDLSTDQRRWLHTAVRDAATAADPVSHRQADSRFHLAVAKVTGSERLLDLVTEVQRSLHDLLLTRPARFALAVASPWR